MPLAYYNEHDAHAARWLENLAEADLIPAGVVDSRDIQEVTPDDVRGFSECHFFSGIGGWPLALRLAGWDPARPVWTGSCPCQPFSSAGKKKGKADPRHLWPYFRDLIAECHPPTIFGEQVASDIGVEWLTGVRADLEALGYAFGAADLCAAGAGEEADGWIVRNDQADWEWFGDRSGEGSWERIRLGAPHIRQRLFWVADSQCPVRGPNVHRRLHGSNGSNAGGEKAECSFTGSSSDAGGLADSGRASVRGEGSRPAGETPRGMQGADGERQWIRPDSGASDAALDGRMADSAIPRCHKQHREAGREDETGRQGNLQQPSFGGGTGFWSSFDIVSCRDNKARRIESQSFPLVDGIPFVLADGRTRRGAKRTALLKGFGNAIVVQVAVTFVRAFLESEQ